MTSERLVPRILALDTGSNTGWAFGPLGSAPPMCGTWPFGRYCDGWGDQLASAADTISNAIKEFRPTVVAYEEVMPVALKTSEACFSHIGIAAIVHLLCYRAQIPCLPIHLSTVRRHFCAHRTKGRVRGKIAAASGEKADIKDFVIAEAIHRGCQPDTHNAADACAIWYFEEKRQLIKVAARI